MRRSAANKAGYPGRMDVDAVTSSENADHDTDSNDTDSDDIEEPEEFFGSSSYDFPPQQDFVGFS